MFSQIYERTGTFNITLYFIIFRDLPEDFPGDVGILCSFLKKLSGSTAVFIFTNLSKFPMKYFSP
ncbi:hypothetical protein HanRHA438_Chr12g0545651 [Helianthus annuus]|nr:hypothetical protein HanRHA438_Chr12g0545651 [Helianthus annuus]